MMFMFVLENSLPVDLGSLFPLPPPPASHVQSGKSVRMWLNAGSSSKSCCTTIEHMLDYPRVLACKTSYCIVRTSQTTGTQLESHAMIWPDVRVEQITIHHETLSLCFAER